MAAHTFNPDPSEDNAPALRAMLLDGKRHIRITGPAMPLETRVIMADDDGNPFHGLRIEPAEGIEKVTIDTSGIGLNPLVISDPSFAGFEYNGGFTSASYLTKSAFGDEQAIYVNQPELYEPGDWVYISDMSNNPAAYLLPIDGPMEVRRVLHRTATALVLDRGLLRSHPMNAVVAKCKPIRDLFIRGLEFTGRSAVGFHAHCAQDGYFSNITTTDWDGRIMLLVDTGGARNVVEDCYCTGTTPGIAIGETTWGVAIEGQEGTRAFRSGGENCGVGLTMNFVTDTVAIGTRARFNTVNTGLYTSSIRSRIVAPVLASPYAANTWITADCIDCEVTE